MSLLSNEVNNNHDLNIHCHSYGEDHDFETTVEPFGGEYTISSYGLRSIDISYESTANGGTIYLNSGSFDINWGFSPINYSAPQYAQTQVFSGNCVSYAIEGLDRTDSGSVLPIRANGTPLRILTDYYPGMIISGLIRALAVEQIEMKPIGKYEVCAPGSYKIAVVCDPYRYYHGIRQNKEGSWSHYLIGEGIRCWDYDNVFIVWPDEARMPHAWANGVGDTHYDLTSFVGYFSIRSTTND